MSTAGTFNLYPKHENQTSVRVLSLYELAHVFFFFSGPSNKSTTIVFKFDVDINIDIDIDNFITSLRSS